jgi:surface carbohydrate biosynthesis protein (TIGR04326 family)
LTEKRANSSLTLWDSKDDPPEYEGRVYLWDGYAEKDFIYSLLRYIENHGERLRGKYLEWVYDLGESQINSKRIIDHLAFEDGLSYWWMTLLVEKSSYKSPIYDVIRFIAAEEIISEWKPAKIRLVSSNKALNEALNGLCRNLGIAYEWKRTPGKSPRRSYLGRLYRVLPHPVQALIWLVRHICVRWPLTKAEKTDWFGGEKSIFLCSYFFQVDPALTKEGIFHSNYWGGLNDLMRKLEISSNWLHHYYPHDAIPGPNAALNLVQRFNQRRHEQGFHTFLDAYLSWRIVIRVLKRWLKLMRISKSLGEIKYTFCSDGSCWPLWPLIREDWNNSMSGPVAIDNLLWIELFDRALSDLPYQKMGLYLGENQSWERALIHAWRKHGHGRLIAVAHTTVRFWDMRYFSDLRTNLLSDSYEMPQPDLTVLNGKAAVDICLGVGYQKKAIVECEALRYNYLNQFKAGKRRDKEIEELKVLVLGDYIPLRTIKMLQLLEEAQPHMKISSTYTMKPHPSYRVDGEDYPSLNLKVVMEHLEKILYDFDVACTGNSTSAAVDAYIAGLQVVVVLDDTELNFSPLRGQSDVRFVSTPEELAEALQIKHQNTVNVQAGNDFFFLDPELPKWNRLLTS